MPNKYICAYCNKTILSQGYLLLHIKHCTHVPKKHSEYIVYHPELRIPNPTLSTSDHKSNDKPNKSSDK